VVRVDLRCTDWRLERGLIAIILGTIFGITGIPQTETQAIH